MKKYDSYKDSGVEWIGEIPDRWNVKPLKHLVKCNEKVLSENTEPSEEIRYIEIGDVSAELGINEPTVYKFSSAPSRARRIVKNGDVIISTVRTYLKAISSIGINNDGDIASTGFAVLTPKYMESGFLGFVSLSEGFISKIISLSKGVSYPSITAQDLTNISIPLPPLTEQTQIAKYLDHKTAQIDSLIAKKERLIELLQEERTAIINQAVTKGLNPNVPMKHSGIEWLGEIPEHWEETRLKFLAKEDNSLFIDGDWIESNVIIEDGIRYITTGNIKAGYYSEQGSGFISEETFRNLNCTEVFEGDLVISRLNNPIGRACIIPNLNNRIVTSVDNVIFRPDSKANKKFLLHLFCSKEYFEHTGLISRGATMQRISRGLLGNIKIPLPPLSEQIEINTYLQFQLKLKDELINKFINEIDLLKEYKTALISEVVTGKVDVREEILS